MKINHNQFTLDCENYRVDHGSGALYPYYGRSTGKLYIVKSQNAEGAILTEVFGDQCGKPCAEHFVRDIRRVYVREDGTRYLSSASGGAYGHKECLTQRVGQAVDTTTLMRDGNVYLAPARVDATNTSVN